MFFANNETAQSTYLKLFKQQGLEAIILDAMIDTHFIQFLEIKNPEVNFERVDSDVTENLLDEQSSSELIEGQDAKTREEKLSEIFRSALGEQVSSVRVEGLKDNSVPVVVLLLDEQSRRFQEMTRMLGETPSEQIQQTLLVNLNNPVIKKIKAYHDQGRQDQVNLLIEQVYDLATLGTRDFDRDKMDKFLERSGQLLEMLTSED